MTTAELKQHFEQNMLDGDKIQSGQMLSSESVFEYMREAFATFLEELELPDTTVKDPTGYVNEANLRAYQNGFKTYRKRCRQVINNVVKSLKGQ